MDICICEKINVFEYRMELDNRNGACETEIYDWLYGNRIYIGFIILHMSIKIRFAWTMLL